MIMLDQMKPYELEALAAELHAQMSGGPEIPGVELNDVKAWITLRRQEAESSSELPFFLNLI